MTRHPSLEIARRLVRDAADTGQRRGLVLAGGADWCTSGAREVLSGLEFGESMWVTAHPPAGVRALSGAQARKVLGREVDALVFDAHSGFDPDAFGAAVGTLRGGGLLLMLVPPLAEWPSFADPERARIAVAPYTASQVGGRFLQRLAEVLSAADGVAVLSQDGSVRQPRPLPRPAAGEGAPPRPAAPYRTEEQRLAVEAVERVARARSPRPLVLTSDRGRGKSGALGLAAARLLRLGSGRILVTAPRLSACEALFEQAAGQLPEAEMGRGRIRWGGGAIEFVPPDDLCLTPRTADLVLVDEAAAIPAPLLEQLLVQYPRLVFATTVHGYEGTGRGFDLRFRKVLDARTPGWEAMRLETPVRWAAGDPVEALVYRALLLDAAPAPPAVAARVRPEDCRIERLDRDLLVRDAHLLGELFGLLVLAHYRTRPYDLRHLLDGPNLGVYVLRAGGHVIGTALTAAEGGIDAATARAVFEGRRRLRGHLIPQSLAAHGALVNAPCLRYTRVMRLAVHPAAQARGLGTRLLGRLVADAAADGCDAVGASFGATPELLGFWARSGFAAVRLGFTREHTSGSHSAMVLRPLSAAGAALQVAARRRLAEDLTELRADVWRDVDPRLVAALDVGAQGGGRPALAPPEWEEIEAFAFAHRGYEASLVPIAKLVRQALVSPTAAAALSTPQRRALELRVVQKRGWAQTAGALGAAGRGEVLAILRGAVGVLAGTVRGEHLQRPDAGPQ